MALATSTSGSVSGQANTQNPQTAGQSSIGGAKSSGVQPGTATSLLTSQQGVSLNPTPLTTVSLNSSSQTQQTATATPKTVVSPRHHINPVLFAFPIILVLAAVILFWTAKRSVKSTTD